MPNNVRSPVNLAFFSPSDSYFSLMALRFEGLLRRDFFLMFGYRE